MAAIDPIVFSKEFQTSRGTLRLVLDVSRLTKDINNYTMKLQQARGIPMNLEAISPADPVAQFIVKNMPWIEADRVIWAAEEHYKRLMQEVTSNAGVIALTLTSDKKLWDVDPTPYDKPEKDELGIDGDVEIPEPEYNLLHPAERRLKQIFDLMVENPSNYLTIQDAISTALILVQRNAGVETDDDGFQPRVVSKPVRGKAVPNSVEPKA